MRITSNSKLIPRLAIYPGLQFVSFKTWRVYQQLLLPSRDHLVYSTPPYHTHCVYIVYYISRLGCAHTGQAVFTSNWCHHDRTIYFLTSSLAVAINLSSVLHIHQCVLQCFILWIICHSYCQHIQWPRLNYLSVICVHVSVICVHVQLITVSFVPRTQFTLDKVRVPVIFTIIWYNNDWWYP